MLFLFIWRRWSVELIRLSTFFLGILRGDGYVEVLEERWVVEGAWQLDRGVFYDVHCLCHDVTADRRWSITTMLWQWWRRSRLTWRLRPTWWRLRPTWRTGMTCLLLLLPSLVLWLVRLLVRLLELLLRMWTMLLLLWRRLPRRVCCRHEFVAHTVPGFLWLLTSRGRSPLGRMWLPCTVSRTTENTQHESVIKDKW